MSAVKILDGVYSVGAMNPSMRVFDIVMHTEYGTTYNSYIVKGSEKTAASWKGAIRRFTSSFSPISKKFALWKRSTTLF